MLQVLFHSIQGMETDNTEGVPLPVYDDDFSVGAAVTSQGASLAVAG